MSIVSAKFALIVLSTNREIHLYLSTYYTIPSNFNYVHSFFENMVLLEVLPVATGYLKVSRRCGIL